MIVQSSECLRKIAHTLRAAVERAPDRLNIRNQSQLSSFSAENKILTDSCHIIRVYIDDVIFSVYDRYIFA